MFLRPFLLDGHCLRDEYIVSPMIYILYHAGTRILYRMYMFNIGFQ